MDVKNNFPNFQKYQVLIFTCKNATIDLTETLHLEIKKVKKRNVVRVGVKASLSDTEAEFPMQPETLRVLQGALEITVVPGDGKLSMSTKCYYYPDSLRHP